jgi:predicted secreted hydrolase/RsiW-degrading membrane proteinase PrsW (M82 family)
MVEWSALPWDTIVLIIVISVIIPILFTFIYIKIRRYEEIGIAIGLFLIILSSVSFFYLIPNEIVEKAMLPEDYMWEDIGDVYYWERNAVFAPSEGYFEMPYQITGLFSKRQPIVKNFKGRQVIHATYYDDEKKEMIIHDALYDENNEIFRVINEMEPISEWYRIDSLLSSLEFVNVDAGKMGIPANSNRTSNKVGWVESNGHENEEENVVLVRDMEKIDEGFINGVKAQVWESTINNKPIVWHETPYFCDETLRLTVNPKTGYILHLYRHLVISARLSQFIDIYSPETLNHRSVNRYLKSTDPIGEAALLIYETTDNSLAEHIDSVKELYNDITYIPLILCVPLFLIGLLILWRYGGRSNYWKRQKSFDDDFVSLRPTYIPSRLRTIKKVLIIIIVGIVIVASLTSIITMFDYYEEKPSTKEDVGELFFEEVLPTPPGSNRGIDLGRHVLEPVDEGAHKSSRREWWYFNVFFNEPGSDLVNWSMIVSFNKMAFNDIRFLKRDNLFVILYDNTSGSYDYGTFDKRRGVLQADGPGVDVTFENSWAKGEYPNWQVHTENAENGFIADLDFTADFLPVWVLGRSSNLPRAKYNAGDYYIPRCIVKGNITFNGNTYSVCGTGYHDHVWETLTSRIITNGWEWLNIHFDNGWEMYLSKFIFRTPLNRYAAALILSPDNRNMVEFNKFSVEYTETAAPQELPLMKHPLKIRVEATNDNMVLNMDIEIYNTCDIVWRLARTGIFEGPCSVSGTFSWSGHSVKLNGYGMSEVTRVKYLLERPRLLIK